MATRLVLVIAALALVSSACGSSRDGDALVADIGDLGHVHDIVVDDSDVLLAAHSGLFRVEGSTRAVLVGEYRHDFMSMAVGPDGLVASGHPDLRFAEWRVEGKPAHLGFVASDDLGGSWTPISLLGEVDFHSLATRADGGFYGADSSGGILSSATGGDWDVRSSMYATDLAASPEAVDRVLGIDGQSGRVVFSDDGARTWLELPAAPLLQRLQWRSDKIVGIAADGTMYQTLVPAGPWTEIGRVDAEVVAFTSRGEKWWIVTAGAAVLHSDDGTNFRSIYDPPARPGT